MTRVVIKPELLSWALERAGIDPLDQSLWPEYQKWMSERLEGLNSVLRPIIRSLDAREWGHSGEDS